MYINFGSINSRQAADGSCTAPLTVDSCGTCRLKKHASLPTITRYDENAYQLFYIAAGKAHFWFDDAEHVVTAGHMVLYRPQEERRYIYYLEDHPEVFWVYFSGSEAAAVLQAHEIPLDGHVFYSGIMPEYKNTFRRMIQELQLLPVRLSGLYGRAVPDDAGAGQPPAAGTAVDQRHHAGADRSRSRLF